MAKADGIVTDPVRRVVILGATSAIAEAVARRYASEGTRLFLVARSRERLEAVADDLRTRGAASVVTAVAELSDPAVHARLLDGIWSELGGIDIAVIAYGVLPDQAVSQRSWAASEEAFRVNFTSPCALLHELANRMEPAGAGVI